MSKNCPVCNEKLGSAALVCTACGSPAADGDGRANHAPPVSPVTKFFTIALIVVCFGLFAQSILPLIVYIVLSPLLDMMSHYAGGVDLSEAATQAYFWALVLTRIVYLVFGILLLIKRNWKIALAITVVSAVRLAVECWVSGTFYGILVLLVAIPCTILLRKNGSVKL